jgi:hypothetical protein
MKLALLLSLVLVFVAGLFPGSAKVLYRVQPVSPMEVDVACTSGRPKTSMRVDGLLEV